MRFLPGLALARRYDPTWLRHDLAAGVVLTALLVPQGMAYAELAGLPAVTGIYATMLPLLAYALFGPSRILVMAPDSAIAPVVAATVIPIAGADPGDRMAVAAFLAVAVGAICIIGGLARLGFVTDLLSKPVRIGYLAGIALVVIVDQLPKLLGLDVGADGLIAQVLELVGEVTALNPLTAAIGVGALVILAGLRRWLPKVPGALVVVVGGIALVAALGLEDDIATVGAVPPGLPAFSIPPIPVEGLQEIALGALAIALVAFTDTSVLSRSYGTRLGERVSQDQELFALGTVNVAAGLFQGFPLSSSSSRTPAAEEAGARTQLTGVAAAIVLGLILLFATGLLAPLPTAILAAIVIVAVAGLCDLPALRRLARLNVLDFSLGIAALLGVALIGVVPGIGIAVGLSAGALLWRTWHPYMAVLGRVQGLKGYHDHDRHPEGRQIPGLVLFRFDAPLFFANAEHFREGVLDAIAVADQPVRRVIVAAEPITDVDSTAEDMLAELLDHLDRHHIGLSLAELKGPVKDQVVRYGLEARLAQPPFPRTVGEAVHDYLEEFDVPWVDWEDEEEHDRPRDAR
ncbi:MAG TPA: SulP family inorganic anion transporter [Candidatus Limnocylindria bacterium]